MEFLSDLKLDFQDCNKLKVITVSFTVDKCHPDYARSFQKLQFGDFKFMIIPLNYFDYKWENTKLEEHFLLMTLFVYILLPSKSSY